MTTSRITLLLVTMAMVSVAGLLLDSISGHARKSASLDVDKSLEVKRYANEPQELVDLKIGEQTVKDKIRTKSRRNTEGLDIVKFSEKADWHHRVSARLRNVSGRSIYGLSGFLHFKPTGQRVMFSMPLTRSRKVTGGAAETG